MKSWVVHYKNKYPNGRVEHSEDKLDVYDNEGVHVVAVRKDGDGVWRDKSKELGALDSHDLSPIPKNARVFKLHADGKIGLDEEAQARANAQKQLMVGGKIHSIAEYKAHGFEVDKEGNVKLELAEASQPPPAPVQPQAPQVPPAQDPEPEW